MAVDRRRPLDRRTRKTEQVEGRTMWPNRRLTTKAPYKGGERGSRYFRIAPPETPHPTFSSRSRIYPTSAMFRGEVGQARLRVGRRSEKRCVPEGGSHPRS